MSNFIDLERAFIHHFCNGKNIIKDSEQVSLLYEKYKKQKRFFNDSFIETRDMDTFINLMTEAVRNADYYEDEPDCYCRTLNTLLDYDLPEKHKQVFKQAIEFIYKDEKKIQKQYWEKIKPKREKINQRNKELFDIVNK